MAALPAFGSHGHGEEDLALWGSASAQPTRLPVTRAPSRADPGWPPGGAHGWHFNTQEKLSTYNSKSHAVRAGGASPETEDAESNTSC
ncbi:hypothetical protein MUG91_G131n41 [Manis pentadactyla]|nr:hypothetical protein MUG91_G131n41 [Manis pentadactyla]